MFCIPGLFVIGNAEITFLNLQNFSISTGTLLTNNRFF